MAPIKSSLARTVGKLLGLQKNQDLSLRGHVQSLRMPPPPLSASGGNAEYTLNGYKYHVFTTNGSLVTTGSPGTVEFLVVGGGAGAGAGAGNDYGRSGGGGGAGGFRCSFTGITPGGPGSSSEPGMSVTGGVTLPVTIGPGGEGFGSGGGSAGTNNGTDSSFGPPSGPERIYAGGGGRGAGGRSNSGKSSDGGSGGGASAQEQNGQPSTSYPGAPNQGGVANPENEGVNQIVAGYPGGRCSSEANTGGGGGGAGAAGEDGSDNDANADGRGGVGKSVPTDMIPTSYGTPGPGPGRYFAGGGFASSENSGGSYEAGGGGGANPDHWPGTPGVQGVANTGGGGGGRGDGQTGGDGGSGIVILRYPVS